MESDFCPTARYRHQKVQTRFLSDLREEISIVWQTCRQADWDGFGALPVTEDTLRNGYQFLEVTPPGLPGTVGWRQTGWPVDV